MPPDERRSTARQRASNRLDRVRSHRRPPGRAGYGAGMILKIRIPRPLFSGARGGLTPLATGTAGQGATFHATLADCMDEWVVRESSQPAVAPRRLDARKQP